jgi:hypothetical protein
MIGSLVPVIADLDKTSVDNDVWNALNPPDLPIVEKLISDSDELRRPLLWVGSTRRSEINFRRVALASDWRGRRSGGREEARMPAF